MSAECSFSVTVLPSFHRLLFRLSFHPCLTFASWRHYFFFPFSETDASGPAGQCLEGNDQNQEGVIALPANDLSFHDNDLTGKTSSPKLRKGEQIGFTNVGKSKDVIMIYS